ncbi:MAG: N-acetyl-gamma-glutamyl-phosphate reductase [Alphaproteobacteria bacterium]
MIASSKDKIRIAILGASGYTGAELLRLLKSHPAADIRALTADRHAGKLITGIFPHLSGWSLPTLVRVEDVVWQDVDVVFCALPHGTTQEVVSALPRHLKVIDLSADFRIRDSETYNKWYGHPHRALDLQKDAVYGLTEVNREQIRKTWLVANPGCYTTAAELPLIPLLKAAAISLDDIIIDAKSGTSGAGRSLKEESLFCEVAEGIHAYALKGHRHSAEIEQELSLAAGRPVTVTFTPHLMPMNRGILSTIYVRLSKNYSAEAAHEVLIKAYANEPFIRVLPPGTAPETRHVRGSNMTLISLTPDRRPGCAVIVSVLDNLVKGASGQAIQNMNLMMGLPETLGLEQAPLFP